jgi:hypothetical protein
LFYSYTGSEDKIKFPSSIASPFCYAIKLQVSLLLLPLFIYPKKRFGCSEKEREDNYPNIERFLNIPSSPQVLQSSREV